MKIQTILKQLNMLSVKNEENPLTAKELQQKCDLFCQKLLSFSKKELMQHASEIWQLKERLTSLNSSDPAVQVCAKTIEDLCRTKLSKRTKIVRQHMQHLLGSDHATHSCWQELSNPSQQQLKCVDLKLLALILSDNWLEGRENLNGELLEGASSQDVARYFKSTIQNRPKLQKQIGQIYEMLQMQVSSLQPHAALTLLTNYCQEKIEELIPSDSSFFFPCGYSGLPATGKFKQYIGHAMTGEIVQQLNGQFALRLFNTGDGAQFHALGAEEGHHTAAVEWPNLSQEQISDPELWKAIFEPSVLPHYFAEDRPYYTSAQVYDYVALVLGREKIEVNTTDGNHEVEIGKRPVKNTSFPIIQGQRSGTCAKKSLDMVALSLYSKDPAEYKLYKIEQKLTALAMGYAALRAKKIPSQDIRDVMEVLHKAETQVSSSLAKLSRHSLTAAQETQLKAFGATFLDCQDALQALRAKTGKQMLARNASNATTIIEPYKVETDLTQIDARRMSQILKNERSALIPQTPLMELTASPLTNIKRLISAEQINQINQYLDMLTEQVKEMFLTSSSTDIDAFLTYAFFAHLPIPVSEQNTWEISKDVPQENVIAMMNKMQHLNHRCFHNAIESQKFTPQHIVNFAKMYRVQILPPVSF